MGYTLIANTLPRGNNNTEFQGWGKQISDAIANCGIVRESDANVGTQINWSTVAAPNTGNQSRGYEIYKFNDAAQATTPVFFKIEYGSSAVTTAPSLWITVGSGANGSGNVTGNTTTRLQLSIAAQASNGINYYSGTSGRFCMSLAATLVVSHIHIGFERTLDANGNPTTDGLCILLANGATIRSQVLWTPTTGNVTAYETTYGFLTPASTPGTGQYGGVSGEHLATYPLFFFNGATLYPPQSMFLCYLNDEFTRNAVVDLPVYGTNVAYMPLGNTSAYNVSPRAGNKGALMMRWD